MRQQTEENPLFLNCLMFSDEATFTNTGQVNRHNMHYWANVSSFYEICHQSTPMELKCLV